MLQQWKQAAKALKQETFALYFACRNPRVSWAAKVLAAVVVAYAFSPIDLIPDFIPVLGYLDDLILIPLGISLVIRLIPSSVMEECREQAQAAIAERPKKPTNRLVAIVIIGLWFVFGLLILVKIVAQNR